MHIIPVIDVRHGIAVRAVAGDRANYQPLVTPLAIIEHASVWGQTHGSDPQMTGHQLSGPPPLTAADVTRAYRRLHPFSTIYIADLDAIEGRGANNGALSALAVASPNVEFWIDAGGKPGGGAAAGIHVVGSEILGEEDIAAPIPRSAVLSLDFRGEEFVGPQGLLEQPDLWPARVIVMTLARVGSGGGPDLARIAGIAARAPRCQIYAAGGIRDTADLHAAHAAGARGALIASALHAQKIKADDLQEIIGL